VAVACASPSVSSVAYRRSGQILTIRSHDPCTISREPLEFFFSQSHASSAGDPGMRERLEISCRLRGCGTCDRPSPDRPEFAALQIRARDMHPGRYHFCGVSPGNDRNRIHLHPGHRDLHHQIGNRSCHRPVIGLHDSFQIPLNLRNRMHPEFPQRLPFPQLIKSFM